MAPDRLIPLQHALILSAGFGMRLRPLTHVRAKPAVPIAGIPMVRRIIDWLVRSGVDRLVINLHHRPETLTAVIGDGSDLSARVRYSWEPIVLGTAGGPRQALSVLEADAFLIVNGDTLAEVDVRALAAAHATSGAMVTLALGPTVDANRYGGVHLDADGAVIRIVPRGALAVGSCHFLGVQIAQADVFRDLPAGVPARTIGGVYDALIARGNGAVRGFVSDPPFFDIGTPVDYWTTSLTFGGLDALMHHGVRGNIAESAQITRSILWDDVTVADRCRLDECIVTDGVRLAPGTSYRRAILRRHDGGGTEAWERIEDGVLVSPLNLPAREPRASA